jgi:hypothetical protein
MDPKKSFLATEVTKGSVKFFGFLGLTLVLSVHFVANLDLLRVHHFWLT